MSAAESPKGTTFAESQDKTNFVVFEPRWLPSDCDVTEITVRPEQPPGRPDDVSADEIGQTPWSDGNPSAVRAVVSGSDRTFRIKEFLYDWAPIAASMAPLWETDHPTPFECGDAVGWIGTDYKDNTGACVQRKRTQIEISVLNGSFDDELPRVLNEMEPAAPQKAATIEQIPFHILNYWFRYGCEAPAVPHGLWEHKVVRPFGSSHTIAPMALADTAVTPLIPDGDRFALDSAVFFPEDEAVECIFRDRENNSDHLWLNAAPKGSAMAPSIPPDPNKQSAETRTTVDLRGTTGHYAALTEDFGAREIFWSEDGINYAVWASASATIDGTEFRSIVEHLVKP
ncbi:hypothetical protein [Haloterrigena salifodinae]|uniref:hypothetical protein n=1 Tax=Haloterrigena salifodinae TaxID=2675099 RepID=UPI001B86F86E|nr:hypothetical protein [Haloterrigena salifodinae]